MNDPIVTIPIAGGVQCRVSAAKAAGFQINDGRGFPEVYDPHSDQAARALRRVAVGLSEGLEGEAAVLRAATLLEEKLSTNERLTVAQLNKEAAQLNKEAAGMQLAAAREANKKR